jgi:D-tyrosyl-tRNA(Tyr) deacylase
VRAVVQRVASASVSIESDGAWGTIGAIDHGLLVYLAAGKGDTETDRAYVLAKILGLRIFYAEHEKKMDRSVLDVRGSLLVVSQFTLYGDVKKGRRPSFEMAMPPEEAARAYNDFVAEAKAHIRVETGKFRADMRVTSVNDGPVTIWIESAR